MNRSAWRIAGAGALLLVSVAAGSWLAALLLPMTGAEAARLVGALAGVGAVALVAGMALVALLSRVLRDALVGRAVAASAVGVVVPAVAVAVLARLMFVNVEHDLPLLVALLVSSGIASAGVVLTVQLVTARRLRALSTAVMRLAATEEVPSAGGRTPPAASPAIGGGADELSRLALALGRLEAALEAARRERAGIEQERADLTAAISHDLRTPLGTIRAVVEAVHDGVVEDPDEVARYLAIARREVDHLDGMVDDLLDLARFDAGAVRLDLRSLPLQEIVAEVADAMSVQAARAGIDLSVAVLGSPPPVRLDGPRVERALGNVLRNAIEHTPRGGRIEVEVVDGRAEGTDGVDGVTVRVRDTGEGIAEDDLPRIWERFYRADPARPRADAEGGAAPGAGIGLAVVAAVVASHGGTVAARSRLGEGTEVALCFPRGAGATG